MFTGWRVSNVGGNTNNGSLDGPFYFNFNNTSSNSNTNISGRLSWAPEFEFQLVSVSSSALVRTSLRF